MTLPRGDDVISPRRPDRGDRLARRRRANGARSSRRARRRSRTSSSSAPARSAPRSRALLAAQGIGVRLIEPERERAREVAEELPGAAASTTPPGSTPTSSSASGSARRRQPCSRCGRTRRTTTPRCSRGSTAWRFTIAIVHDPISTQVYEHSGIDVTVNPRGVTAEEIVRFAHDPRTQQVAMLEGDRYEVLDITTQPTSEYVGLRFRDMPIRGALIGAIVRDGRARLPAQRRRAPGRRPGDRVHRVVPRARRREGAVSPRPPAPSGGSRRHGARRSTSAAALGARRHAAQVPLARRRSCPLRFAIGYGEPVLAVPGLAGAVAAVVGWALERGLGGATSVGFREGYLVVALTWLLAAALRRAALPALSGEPQLDRPLDALFESMSGFTTTGATVLTDVESLDRSLLMWRQFTQWLGGMGIIVLALAVLPRLRVGGRQLLESELPGPEIDQLADRIRDTAQRLWLLYLGADGGARRDPRRDRLRSATIAMGLFEASRPGVRDDADRRLLDRDALDRGVRAAVQWVIARLHAARRGELRAALPRVRPAPAAERGARRGAAALPRRARRRLGACSRRELWTEGFAER